MKRRNIKALVEKAIRNSPYADMVERISLFGSRARGEATASSDVDLLIDLDPDAPIGYFEYHGIQKTLEKALDCKVDLVEREGLSPHLADRIVSDAKPIYER